MYVSKSLYAHQLDQGSEVYDCVYGIKCMFKGLTTQ